MAEPPDSRSAAWQEERRLFEILDRVYQATSGRCTAVISLWDFEDHVGGDLQRTAERYATLFRAVNRLERHGYVLRMWRSPLFCITPKGIQYIERRAGRRRSIRLETAATG